MFKFQVKGYFIYYLYLGLVRDDVLSYKKSCGLRSREATNRRNARAYFLVKEKELNVKTLGYLPRVLFFNAFELGAENCKSSNIK
jgi:hypothetical protein